MNEGQPESRNNAPDPGWLGERAQKSRQAWRRFGLWLRGITPAELLRFLLVVGVATFLIWLVAQAWGALVPFVVGIILAYILLPVVNWLDRFLPRGLASILAMATAVGLLVLFLSQFIPLLVNQVEYLSTVLPDRAQWQEYTDQVSGTIDSLPAPIQLAVRRTLDSMATDFQDAIQSYLDNSLSLLVDAFLGLFQALGFIIGLIVLPTWLLTVLNEQRKGAQAINRSLPDSVQPDFWAVIRIFNRTFSRFIRGQFLIALAAGLLVYGGLVIIERLGLVDIRYKMAIAMFSAIFALVPDLGAIIGSLPWILLGFTISNQLGLASIIMYGLVWFLIGQFVQPHVEKRVVDVHPAILVVLIVILSELGLAWIFVAAPMIAIFRDLVRYAFGRLSDPPRPAGLLPGESLPVQAAATQGRVPLAYRRGQSRPSSGQQGRA